MPERDVLRPMEVPGGMEALFPDRASGEPLGRQFVRRLRAAIQNGHFKPASRLLPSRELAARLGLSRNTVVSAIEQLIAEGFLESRVGSGTYVAATIVAASPVLERKPRRAPAAAEHFDAVRDLFENSLISGPLRAGVPDLAAFPHTTWARITRRKIANLSQYIDYRYAQGDPSLREAIAQHVRQFRGITADASQVVVVEGAQAAYRLAMDVLVDRDDVLIEDPCYPLLYAALVARRIHVVPIPVDAAGMRVAECPVARAAFVSPSHQFPLGSRMSMERRYELLAWAFEHDAYVIEDDYDSEYTFDGKPLPALASIDRNERVLYVGTFSKTLAPGLRLGYLIVPPHLTDRFAVARVLSTNGGSRYVQATLADFLSEGHLARYIRRMTRVYAQRRTALLALLENGLRGTPFTLGTVSVGLSLVIDAPADFDDVAVRDELLERGVEVQPLSSFCIARSDCRGFVVGYGAEPIPAVEAAARELIVSLRARATLTA